MEAASPGGPETIVMLKSVQVGFSEALRNILGYWIACEPGPCLVVMPSEETARALIAEKIMPLLEGTPVLREKISEVRRDTTLSVIRLNTMDLYIGWAGSPASLASRPCRYVILDEVDKYPPFSGREADPVRLATERTATYGRRRKIIIGSTPTTRTGVIYQAWESADARREYEVPCPHCGKFQPLIFSQVRWSKESGPKGEVWYECSSCSATIDEAQRLPLISQGRWSGGSGKVVGFRVNSLVSPWRPWSAAATEFLRCKDDAAALQNFRNSWLGEPFEIQITRTTNSSIRTKLEGSPPARVAPVWANVLYLSADVQQDRIYYVVRAWAGGLRSQLIHHGIALNLGALKHLFESCWPVEGRPGRTIAPQGLVIDSGYRSEEVYAFCLGINGKAVPIKGSSRGMEKPWRPTYLPVTGGQSIELRLIDTGFYKDMLSRLMGDADSTKWAVNSEATDEYLHHLTSEHKVLNRKTGHASWEPITSGAANHFWDCEVYQCAAADWGGLYGLPFSPEPAAPPAPARPVEAPPQRLDAFAREMDELQQGTKSARGGWAVKIWQGER